MPKNKCITVIKTQKSSKFDQLQWKIIETFSSTPTQNLFWLREKLLAESLNKQMSSANLSSNALQHLDFVSIFFINLTRHT